MHGILGTCTVLVMAAAVEHSKGWEEGGLNKQHVHLDCLASFFLLFSRFENICEYYSQDFPMTFLRNSNEIFS